MLKLTYFLLMSLSSGAFALPLFQEDDLRHSFASNFVMAGGEIYKLQRLLGHSSIQMTERYSHLSPDHLADATEILDFGTRISWKSDSHHGMSQVDKKLTKIFRGVVFDC